MNPKHRLCWLSCLAACSYGCGDDAAPNENGDPTPIAIASTPLSGEIGGQAWTIDHADTLNALSDDETFFLTAYSEPAAACESFFQSTQNELIVIVPKVPGDYAISLARAATFVVDPQGKNDNLVAIRGRLIVDEVTKTSLSGGLALEYNEANHVNGRFEASVCPPE